MRTKVTLVLIFLNVALFFFIFKFERNWRTEAASLEARRRVLGPEAANIRSLEISRNTGGAFSLVRNRDAWFLTQPLDWPANQHAVSTILLGLQLLEHETSFRVADLAKTNQSLADYGLDQPRITVRFSSGDAAGTAATGPSTLLRIGDLTKDGKRLYVLSPDGTRVHVVERALVDTLSFPLDQLRADTLLTIPVFEARSLSIQIASPDQDRGGAPGVRTRIRREAARWRFETPIIAYASKTAVDLVINELNALHPRAFDPPAPSAPAADAPELRITLEGNNRHETLLLQEPLGSAGGPNAGPALVEYRAELEGRNARFTVALPVRLLAALRNAQENLREKRILDEFDPGTVTAITLAAPLFSSPTVMLQRLDATAGAAPANGPQWQIVQRGGDNQAPRTLPADREAVQRLLQRLAVLTAEKFTSDAPTSADLEAWGFNRAEREVTLTFAGSKPPIILRLGTDAGTPRNVFARVGTPADPGSSIYNVTLDLRRELPVELVEWRDRTLREPLPPGARFTAFKLVDLNSKQVVYETAFDAAGEPVATPRGPGAVADILLQLRSLRAKSILPMGFAEKVPVGGEERPWRFQLDTTIALPGGGGAETASAMTLYFTDRLGGAQQYAGSRDLDVIFEIEQPLLDALWSLVAQDPGPPDTAAKK